MVHKELKMKFRSLFVCNYALIHTHFIVTCFLHTIKIHLKADWKVISTISTALMDCSCVFMVTTDFFIQTLLLYVFVSVNSHSRIIF